MRRYPILPIIRSDPLVNLNRTEFVDSKKFHLKLLRAVTSIRDTQKNYIQACECFRFTDVITCFFRTCSRLSWIMVFVFHKITRTDEKMSRFPQFLPTGLKYIFEYSLHITDMSIAQSSRESTVACKWVFISDFHFFYTSRSTWHTTECYNTYRFNKRSDSIRCLW